MFEERPPTREQHLAWGKKSALERLDYGGNVGAAMTTMLSELRGHPETENMARSTVNHLRAHAIVWANDRKEARRFIESFY